MKRGPIGHSLEHHSVMGAADDLVVGALLRVVGKYDQNNLVHGEQLVVLTRLAKVLGQ